MNNKDADQTEKVCRLICIFVVRLVSFSRDKTHESFSRDPLSYFLHCFPCQLIFSIFYAISGETKSLAGTIEDLRKPVLLGDILEKMPRGDGLHSANVLPGKAGAKKLAARY